MRTTHKFKISTTILLFLMVLNPFFAKSNSTIIKGKVVDKTSLQPLDQVQVILKNISTNIKSKQYTDKNGKFEFKGIDAGKYLISSSKRGYKGKTTNTIIAEKDKEKIIVIKMIKHIPQKQEIVLLKDEAEEAPMIKEQVAMSSNYKRKKMYSPSGMGSFDSYSPQFNTESYNFITVNEFKNTKTTPLSTFSIDVDAASYSNIRRFVNQGQNPPKDAVRIEEMINYFNYDYPQPTGKDPFSITTEISDCPWNKNNKLVHIGLQGKKLDMEDIPASNIVFLVDVSGSMNSSNKLPLLKNAFKLLTNNLREEDRVAIVVYAGAAGVVLESTPGNQKEKIMDALNKLSAGGSTAGGAGIKLAYKIANENYIKEGNNRIVLATDGDFNIGASSDGEMGRLIEKERESGVFLTCLGFGMGNYKDSKMETLADKGNGNYAYIDNIMEAKKVLVNEFGATMVTIAKDVKLQVEFNPNKIKSYKLIGYENRLLNDEDFNNDKKDAGELGAGHTVTALYEVVLKGSKTAVPDIDPLRYQENFESETAQTNEILTVKFRYKQPKETKSTLIVEHLKDKKVSLSKASNNFKFSAAVAEFGLLLRDSKHKENAKYSNVIALAKSAKGEDENGYRAEFIRLVEMCEMQANN